MKGHLSAQVVQEADAPPQDPAAQRVRIGQLENRMAALRELEDQALTDLLTVFLGPQVSLHGICAWLQVLPGMMTACTAATTKTHA